MAISVIERLPGKGLLATGAASGGAMLLALGLWIFSEGDGPRQGDDFLAYQDIAKVWTVCHGHTGPDVTPGLRVSKAECRKLAESDLGKAFAAEDKYVRNVEALPAHTRAAVAVFIGNVGPEAFRGSSVLKFLNLRRIRDACNALLLWNKARVGPTGKLVVVQGLINRRERERKLCMGEAW